MGIVNEDPTDILVKMIFRMIAAAVKTAVQSVDPSIIVFM